MFWRLSHFKATHYHQVAFAGQGFIPCFMRTSTDPVEDILSLALAVCTLSWYAVRALAKLGPQHEML